MVFFIKPGNLMIMDEWNSFQKTISESKRPDVCYKISLENTIKMDLAFFNQLVVLYTRLRRSGVNVSYINYGEYIRNYVNKTNFQHVFPGQ